MNKSNNRFYRTFTTCERFEGKKKNEIFIDFFGNVRGRNGLRDERFVHTTHSICSYSRLQFILFVYKQSQALF